MGGAGDFLMSLHRYHSTLLKCPGCNGLGALTWDLKYHDDGKDTPFVGIAGDFRIDRERSPSDKAIIICVQCDQIYGPLPETSCV